MHKNSLLQSPFLVIIFVLLAANTQAKDGPSNVVIDRIVTFTTQSSIKLELTFRDMPPADAKFSVTLTGTQSKEVLFNNLVSPSQNRKEENKMIFVIKNLVPDLWSPLTPNLYQLSFSVSQAGGNSPVKIESRIGFRFFESRNGNLHLNGKPIFLRGIAINPPARGIPDSIEKSRKFAEDYVRFMQSIHVNIIRIPNNETWYNVCDELGMMVFGGNYSSTVNGEKPPKDYDKAVKWYQNDAFANIASHPSLMIYAMTNEVPYEGKTGEAWEKFLTYAHAELRKWDSTRTYIANPGYGYGKSGDICDLHRYWGWYYCSPFTFLHIRDNSLIIPFKKGIQPVTFTECVGNYTGPDGKYNLTPDHKNPGSQLNWTGHAGWDEQARLADEHQSFTFKQATELFRRLRIINPELSGVFPFTILFHNWNNVQRFVDMSPKPVTKQAKLSYQPILISWENWKSQVYSGSTIAPFIHIVNDDDGLNDLYEATLVYQLQDNALQVIKSDTISLPRIAYYSTWRTQVSIKLPEHLPVGNYRLTGKILSNGKLISENFDKIFIAGKGFVAASGTPSQKIVVYDSSGKTGTALNKLRFVTEKFSTAEKLQAGTLLVIGENSFDESIRQQAGRLKQFVSQGGRILCLRQDEKNFPFLNSLLNISLKNVTTGLDIPAYPPPPRPSRNGYYVNPERPDHPVFSGIKREHLRVWSDYTNWDESKKGFPAIYPITDGYVVEDKKDLQRMAVLGNYGVALEGITIAEIFNEKGSVLVCGLDLVNRTGLDPVSDRMLMNIVSYMADMQKHQVYPLVTAPIIWGDYPSEKGILTGVNSGLMVHAVPRVPANIKSKVSVTREGNRFLGLPGGFNTRPGVQYVAYGRRMYGPYVLRGFGNVPEPVDTTGNIGEGFFWCSIPKNKTMSTSLVWNQSDIPLTIQIEVNDANKVNKQIKPGETITIDCPVNSEIIKMRFRGDRRLVLLQTSFQ